MGRKHEIAVPPQASHLLEAFGNLRGPMDPERRVAEIFRGSSPGMYLLMFARALFI